MDNWQDSVEPRERLIESLILDGSTHLWVASEFRMHIEKVLRRIPSEYLEKLAEKDFKFLAPERMLGLVTQWDHSLQSGDFVVFLSPELLSRAAEEIHAVIAHELAELVLWHDEAPSPDARRLAEQNEREADELIRFWGFEIPPSFDRY